VNRLLLAGAVIVSAGALALAALRAPAAPPTMDDRVHAIASTLRCPVCLNLSVADSPSPVAEEMRGTIRRDLEAGKTPTQITQEFVDAYGEWILLAPRPHGINLLAWILPGILALAGLAGAGWLIWRWTRSARRAEGPTGISEADRTLLDEALAGAGEPE